MPTKSKLAPFLKIDFWQALFISQLNEDNVCRGAPNMEKAAQYEKALRAVLGNETYSKDGGEPLKLSRPAVAVHITATPVPLLLGMVNHGVDLAPGRLSCLNDPDDYIGVSDYKWLCEPGTDVPVHLDDGDLKKENSFADHWKVNLWLDDLDSTPHGLGLYIANSRGDDWLGDGFGR